MVPLAGQRDRSAHRPGGPADLSALVPRPHRVVSQGVLIVLFVCHAQTLHGTAIYAAYIEPPWHHPN